MANIADFVNDIAYLLPDAPQGLLQEAAFDALNMFMQDTGLATDYVTLKLEGGQDEYLLLIPECRALVKVLNVRWQQKTGLLHEPPLKFEMVGNQQTLKICDSYAYGVPPCEENTCEKSCEPECERLVEVDYAWALTTTSCAFPDHLLGLYKRVVVNAVRYFAHRMYKQEWTDIALSDRAYIEYRAQVDDIKERAMNKFVNRPMRAAKVSSSVFGAWNQTNSGRR